MLISRSKQSIMKLPELSLLFGADGCLRRFERLPVHRQRHLFENYFDTLAICVSHLLDNTGRALTVGALEI